MLGRCGAYGVTHIEPRLRVVAPLGVADEAHRPVGDDVGRCSGAFVRTRPSMFQKVFSKPPFEIAHSSKNGGLTSTGQAFRYLPKIAVR